ncbi:BQ5605_C021g09344 [Microbotryum silenes-dioicae]|uniref:BQ5605_C021g09344 protein n=1 Tax=Microbotryum silenes-dioicae TaxID=796604 RepID=A0A2X0ND37_9BASI|nr:BQ5605_C021g09344 [Microbotryum silenes-dioicae]
MATTNNTWPPALKAFVNDTFAKCTDHNRPAVEKELKTLIFDAFKRSKEELWNIDWSKVELESLKPPSKKRKLTSPLRVPRIAHKAPSIVHSSPASYGITHGLENHRREERARRFNNGSPLGNGVASTSSSFAANPPGRLAQAGVNPLFHSSTPEPDSVYDPNVIDWDHHTIVGTSTVLEKRFLRLTSVPDPSTIRPLPVLKKSFEVLKQKWKDGEVTYPWICDQFKSMRQDLTVQRIKNEFVVQVYEIHGRLALENGDLGEFNQCQGQLRDLFKLGIPGHREEFLAYRILYLLYSRNRAELNATLGNLTPEDTKHKAVAHALAVRLASSQGNYAKFFRLFKSAPGMNGYLMDPMVDRERVSGLVLLTKSYLDIELTFLASQFAFQKSVKGPNNTYIEVDDLDDLIAFLTKHNASQFKPFTPGTPDANKRLDCKTVQGSLQLALAKFTKVDIKGQV